MSGREFGLVWEFILLGYHRWLPPLRFDSRGRFSWLEYLLSEEHGNAAR